MKVRCNKCNHIFSEWEAQEDDDHTCPYCFGPAKNIDYIETREDKEARQLDYMDI